ncbi:MAG: PorT family protein [Flavobacteriaceae bacterium]
MKKLFISLFVFSITCCFGQKDTLQIGDKYADDQLYVSLTYNQFFSQPTQVSGTSFSFGLSGGFIKDIPFTNRGNVSLGIGLGYGFDSFNHGIKVSALANDYTFSVDNTISSNKLSIQTIELPLELRWRTSTVNKYKFWRIYTGVKFGYNISNKFSYVENSNTVLIKNIPNFKRLQYGLTLSAGYDAFNAHIYYGLTPLLENASIGTSPINTKIIKIGLIFYIL